MKKILLLLLLAVGFMMPASAQGKHKGHDEMRREITQFKMKFLAQEMELRDDQQKRFFELYSRMSEERHDVIHNSKALERKLSKSTDATEEEYEQASKAITEARQKDAEIERKYDAEFAKFLSSKQIFKMKEAEGKFRDKLHQMKNKRKRMK